MDDFDRLLEQGKKVGLEGDSLIKYINDQQARIDRTLEREEKKKQLEHEDKQKQLETERALQEKKLETERALQEMKIRLDHEANLLKIGHDAKVELEKIEAEKLKDTKQNSKHSSEVFSKLPKIPVFSPKTGDSFDSFLYRFEIHVKKL